MLEKCPYFRLPVNERTGEVQSPWCVAAAYVNGMGNVECTGYLIDGCPKREIINNNHLPATLKDPVLTKV